MDEAAIHWYIYGKPNRASERSYDIDWATIRRELAKKGVTLQLLWQEYRQ